MSVYHFDYDVVVIGAGSGGYAAAGTAAAEGLKAVAIEGGEQVGGLCILRGCMPTKALLYAAEVMHLASHASPWGIRAEDVSFNFKQVMARKNTLIKEFADYRVEQLNSGKFDFLRAHARFVDAHTVELSDVSIPLTPTLPHSSVAKAMEDRREREKPYSHSGIKRIRARHFVIATGSKISPSPVAGLDQVGFMTSDSALQLEQLPKSLIVLGGGAVAVEFAQFFVRFGVKTTLIQRSPHILHEFDPDAARDLEIVLRREGITLYTGTKLLGAKRVGSHKEISFEHEGKTVHVHGDDIFYALGRVPNVSNLGLEKIGVHLEYGRITTNHLMQTSVPHIYAAGDCTGLHEIVHIAVQQGEIAAHNIARPKQPRQMDYRLLTEVIFTEPQVAAVGLTEKKAHTKNIPYLVASYAFRDHGKSLIMEAKDGFVKLLCDPISGEIIGGSCVGPLGGELIHEITAAMYKHMTVHELAAMPHYHPTLAEIWTYPAEELAGQIRA
jgi:pyruvate/2-oxoglutarate dehydrogenase complex dihydrolipoamide dehydrogenase (E3) component